MREHSRVLSPGPTAPPWAWFTEDCVRVSFKAKGMMACEKSEAAVSRSWGTVSLHRGSVLWS